MSAVDEKTMSVHELEQVQTSVDLIRQGEELEAVEKTTKFWTAVKQHKMLMFYCE